MVVSKQASKRSSSSLMIYEESHFRDGWSMIFWLKNSPFFLSRRVDHGLGKMPWPVLDQPELIRVRRIIYIFWEIEMCYMVQDLECKISNYNTNSLNPKKTFLMYNFFSWYQFLDLLCCFFVKSMSRILKSL